jgi:hypothetical protein
MTSWVDVSSPSRYRLWARAQRTIAASSLSRSGGDGSRPWAVFTKSSQIASPSRVNSDCEMGQPSATSTVMASTPKSFIRTVASSCGPHLTRPEGIAPFPFLSGTCRARPRACVRGFEAGVLMPSSWRSRSCRAMSPRRIAPLIGAHFGDGLSISSFHLPAVLMGWEVPLGG